MITLFEAAVVDMARCRCERASSNGVRCNAPRADREGNHAKSASARIACSVGGRPVLHGAKRARAACHGIRKLRLRCYEAADADMARSRCGRTSAHGVGWREAWSLCFSAV